MAELNPSQSTLSPNFAPYVYDMLSKGQAAAGLPFQPYTGERFAGLLTFNNKPSQVSVHLVSTTRRSSTPAWGR